MRRCHYFGRGCTFIAPGAGGIGVLDRLFMTLERRATIAFSL